MKIRIYSVGKLKEKFWVEACKEYLKRLGAYAKVEVHEVPDIDPAKAGGEDATREKEGQALLDAIPVQSHVVCLAIEGKQYTSEAFSRHLDQLALQGKSDISFVIGGSVGLSPAVYERAQELFSFGKITLPHNLAKVVLLEQIYRAFRISRNEPYHK